MSIKYSTGHNGRISSEKMDQRDRDIMALATMKKLERQRAKRMRSERIDSKTVICSTPRRLKEMKQLLTGAKPMSGVDKTDTEIPEINDDYEDIY